MRYSICLSALTLSLTAASSALQAAEPILLQQATFADIKATFALVLPTALHAKRARSDRLDTLVLVSEHTDEQQLTHVRLQQQYAGFPVLGGYAITHSSIKASQLWKATQEVPMSGVIYRSLQSTLGEPPTHFVENGAVLLQQFEAKYNPSLLDEAKVIPLVYINDDHEAFWAYKMSVLVYHHDRLPERPTVIVDAKTHQPLMEWNDLKTARLAVSGVGFGGNERIGAYQFGKDRPLLSLSRDASTATCYMETPAVKVVDMVHRMSGSNTAMHFSCEKPDDAFPNAYWVGYSSDGYDVENGAYSPSNDALYAGEVIKRMYQDWYGIPVLTQHGKPMPLVMRVHFGQGYENAFWDGKQMTFGDGGSMLYPLVSLGIGAHEISHGFTEQHADLEYVGQSGGMNESFSDMASQVAEYYSKGVSTWVIGADVLKEKSGRDALRYMDKPSRDGKSIDKASQYRRDLDVHYASGVYNRLFYVLATTPGWDPRKAFHVMLKANMDYWTPYSTFAEGACGILSATAALGFSDDEVRQALDAVDIHYSSCMG